MLQYTRCEIIQFAHRIPKNYQNWLDERVFVEQNNENFCEIYIKKIFRNDLWSCEKYGPCKGWFEKMMQNVY